MALPRLLDPYARQAWHYPALITLLPLLAMTAPAYPEMLGKPGSALAGLAIAVGLLYAAGSFARHRGKLVEPKLLERWGGWPTTLWLRHSTSYLDPLTKQRFHRYLEEKIKGLTMPTPAE